MARQLQGVSGTGERGEGEISRKIPTDNPTKVSVGVEQQGLGPRRITIPDLMLAMEHHGFHHFRVVMPYGNLHNISGLVRRNGVAEFIRRIHWNPVDIEDYISGLNPSLGRGTIFGNILRHNALDRRHSRLIRHPLIDHTGGNTERGLANFRGCVRL